jgi:hypothetical protein
MHFEILGDIKKVETIAVGGNIRDIMWLRKQYGPGRWRKLKGIAQICLQRVRYAMLRYIGMNPMVLVERNLK